MYIKFADHIFIIKNKTPGVKILPNNHDFFGDFIFFTSPPKETACTCSEIDYEVKNFVLDDSYIKVPGSAINGWTLLKNSSEYVFCPKAGNWNLVIKKDFSSISVLSPEEMIQNNNGAKTVENVFQSTLLQLLLMHTFFKLDGIIIHSSAMIIRGKGFIFPGVSGAGKSTIAKWLTENKLGIHLSDERNFIREVKGKFKLFGSPWKSAAGLASAEQAPLSAIVFIAHGGEEPVLRRLAQQDAAFRLLGTVTIPLFERDFTALVVDLVSKIVGRIPVYEFSYKPGAQAKKFFTEFAHNS